MTSCISFFAATLTPYVRMSAFAFSRNSFFYVCYQERSFSSLTKKCYLTSNSLNFFHFILYTKSAYHFMKMRKLSYSKIFKAIRVSWVPILVNVRVTEMLEFPISLLVVFQFMLYSLFFSGVKTLSR